MNSSFKLCAAVTLATLLAACGGGGSSVAVDPTIGGSDVPASAVASPQAYTAYVGSLPPDDTAEPLRLEGVEPPTTDTEEPVEVI